MRLNFLQGIMGRSLAAESIATIQEIRFEYRLHDQQRRHLDHAISYRRYAQWPQLSICFLNPYSPHRLRPVRFPLQRLLDFIQKPLDPAFAFFDHLDRYAVHAGRSLVGFHPFPCRFQCVASKDPVIQYVEPKLWLLFSRFFAIDGRLRLNPTDWPLPTRNEAESSSLSLRLMGSPCKAS